MKTFFKFVDSSRTTKVLFLEIIISVLLSLTSLFLFLKIGSEILKKETVLFDTAVTSFIFSLKSAQTTDIMLFFTLLGSFLVFVVISLLMILYIHTKGKKDVIIYLSILYSGVILNLLLKYFFQRPRPELGLINEVTFSFPSGHAMNSFILFMTLSYFIYRESKNMKLSILITILSIFLIFMIGASRIYLGVHYPSDVLAGYIAGFFLLISAILFGKVIFFENLYKSSKK